MFTWSAKGWSGCLIPTPPEPFPITLPAGHFRRNSLLFLHVAKSPRPPNTHKLCTPLHSSTHQLGDFYFTRPDHLEGSAAPRVTLRETKEVIQSILQMSQRHPIPKMQGRKNGQISRTLSAILWTGISLVVFPTPALVQSSFSPLEDITSTPTTTHRNTRSREPMRVERGEYGAAPELKGEGNGRSPKKNSDGQRHRTARFPHPKIRERPGSPGWEACSLTTISQEEQSSKCVKHIAPAHASTSTSVATKKRIENSCVVFSRSYFQSVNPHRRGARNCRYSSRLVVEILFYTLLQVTGIQGGDSDANSAYNHVGTSVVLGWGRGRFLDCGIHERDPEPARAPHRRNSREDGRFCAPRDTTRRLVAGRNNAFVRASLLGAGLFLRPEGLFISQLLDLEFRINLCKATLFAVLEMANERKHCDCLSAFDGTAVAERLVCSPPTKANQVQSPSGPLPDFRMWDDATGWGVSSGISRFPRTFIPVLLHTSITLIGSQDFDIKSRTDIFKVRLPASGFSLLGRETRELQGFHLHALQECDRRYAQGCALFPGIPFDLKHAHPYYSSRYHFIDEKYVVKFNTRSYQQPLHACYCESLLPFPSSSDEQGRASKELLVTRGVQGDSQRRAVTTAISLPGLTVLVIALALSARLVVRGPFKSGQRGYLSRSGSQSRQYGSLKDCVTLRARCAKTVKRLMTRGSKVCGLRASVHAAVTDLICKEHRNNVQRLLRRDDEAPGARVSVDRIATLLLELER
ncbi:hypothetical protein PR048_017407 [Dryococelus australis]|uniref:Uncharacterized protein n=1 Tax=Dryococelus australis TaxID=614101 RepID=A0ABQ9H9G7_9NEOP|nr:hypothetical protein PR048_017407 [Dryococelus australis]